MSTAVASSTAVVATAGVSIGRFTGTRNILGVRWPIYRSGESFRWLRMAGRRTQHESYAFFCLGKSIPWMSNGSGMRYDVRFGQSL